MRVPFAVFGFTLLILLAGCGGGGGATSTTMTPVFSLAAASYPAAQTVTLTDSTSGASIFYTTDGSVPTSASARYSAPITVSASQVVQAFATAPHHTDSGIASASYTIVPLTISATSFNFGQNIVGNTLAKTVATVTNAASTSAPLTISFSGDSGYALASSSPCGTTVAANSSCTLVVNYDPTAAGTQSATMKVGVTGSPSTPLAVALSGVSAVLAPGIVSSTINPQVALYTITPPFAANVTVSFGPDTTYGLNTSARPSAATGGPVATFVAGMRASTQYHMRATVSFTNGITLNDVDQTFTTGAVPAGIVPGGTVATTTGLTPQPGIELIDTILGGTASAAIATDLAGNVIWTYPFPDRQPTSLLYPIKLMSNGNLIMELGPVSQSIVNGPTPAGSLVVLREIDLAGDIVQQLSMQDLNTRLAASGLAPGLTLQVFSHDMALLPNGHILVNTNTIKSFTNLTGYPGVTNVVGDVIVDLDENMNPVWVWNEFDHFDVNRHPYSFPDWTHTNAVVYSPDDGDIIVSIRHQNWVVKVNYNNGLGDGSVLWKLGYQGDFTLVGGTDPTDWFYAQHNPSFFSTNTSGSFSLGLMDNGDDRVFPDGSNCDIQGGSYCYTTIPILQIDETAKTATLTSHQILPTSLYSSFAGNTELLANGNVEYNLAGVGSDALTYEVTPGSTPQTVWQMHIFGTNTYREFRIPSLYPGVQW